MAKKRRQTDAATDRDRATNPAADVEPNARDAALGANGLPAFDSPVRVGIHSIRKRLADPDGVAGKHAIDGLVACEILSDDSAKQIIEVRFSQSKGSRERTVITIEAAE